MRNRGAVEVAICVLLLCLQVACARSPEDREPVFEGSLRVVSGSIRLGSGGLGPMTETVQITTSDGTYDLQTSDQTRFVNLPVSNGMVTYNLQDAVHYRVRGRIASDLQPATGSSRGVIVASVVELISSDSPRKEREVATLAPSTSDSQRIRASHIMFKSDGKNDAAVRAKAEEVLKQVKAGVDFATLAKKYSEDEATAKYGGDLNYFVRGQLLPEFEQAVWKLSVDEISGIVKTQFRLHIIKRTE